MVGGARSRWFDPLAVLVAALATAGCGQASPAAPAVPPSAVPISVTAPPVTVDPAVPTAAAAPTSWVMPNLVGVNLQDAQNRIQSLTTYAIAITTSHDATGAGRQQIVDRNWKVCSQNVPPGQRITADTKIDFGAVKTTERC
jgi:ABC-type transport system substrate-binding protein